MTTTQAYKFKTKPYMQQRKAFEASAEGSLFALLMEPGTGKTKVTLDTARYLYLQKEIDTLVVVAPNLVHQQWIDDELPVHLNKTVGAYYKPGTKNTAIRKVLEVRNQLRVVTFNTEAAGSASGQRALREVLGSTKALFAIDESQRFKTPSAKRTRALWKLAQLARYRRILSGTPTSQGLEDLYAQFRILDHRIIGANTFAEFKAEYCNLVGEYNKIVGYRNEKELFAKIAPYSFVCELLDCVDLPPQVIYPPLRIPLTSQQKRAYNELRESFITELDSGTIIEGELAITRLQKLQQIASGHVQLGEGKWEPLDAAPRIEATIDLIKNAPGKVIVWCRWKPDVIQLAAAFKKAGIHGVTYYGGNDRDTNKRNKELFLKNDRAQVFLGTPSSGGTGLNLQVAEDVINFSHTFSYEERFQSLRRNFRIGQDKPTRVHDLIAPGTVEPRILRVLRAKGDVAKLLYDPDTFKAWLRDAGTFAGAA